MGVDGSLQTLLDISGHEIYSAIFTSIREVSVTLTILIAALVADVELKHVGFMFLVNMVVFFLLNVAYIAYMGFWRKYYSGLIFSFALAVSTNRNRVVCAHAFFLYSLGDSYHFLVLVHYIYIQNLKVSKSIISTALPLSFGYLITYGE